MQVAVIGANGGIGRKIVAQLADSGHDPIGVVRDESQFETVRDCGGEPRLGDLEGEITSALRGTDAVVFTAGSGSGTGLDKTLLVDLWGARRSIDVCVEHDIDRYVMISSYGAGEPLSGPEPLRPYLVAKRSADDYLKSSSLDATILRPTALSDEDGSGTISVSAGGHEGSQEIPRADVATTALACLDTEQTIGETIQLFGGDTPIEQAIRSTD